MRFATDPGQSVAALMTRDSASGSDMTGISPLLIAAAAAASSASSEAMRFSKNSAPRRAAASFRSIWLCT